MVREVLTVCIGEGGVQLGQTIWEQYCLEHSIDHKGQKQTNNSDRSFLTHFEEIGAGQFVPRNLSVDLEPNVIDSIKTSKYSKIFHPEYLLCGKEDAANNFARGHYTVGKEMIDCVNDRLRKLVYNCDNVQGFVVHNAVGGGTGSGLGSLILERIAVDYRKKSKLGFHIYPFNNNHSKAQTEAYNALLSTHWFLDHTEASIMFDNRKIYDMCNKKLDIQTPNYHNMNCLISKVVSSMTASLRFEGELNVDLNELQVGVTFPRLHFFTPSMAPIMNKQAYMKNKRILVDGFVRNSLNYKIKEIEMQKECIYNGLLYQDLMNMIYHVYDIGCPNFTVYDIAKQLFDSDNFMVECLDFDAEQDKYMRLSLNFRGNVLAKEANVAAQQLKQNKLVTFVEWCPTGFKIGLNEDLPAILENDCVEFEKINAVGILDNTFISRYFSERISKTYDKMYSQRAFVHWYVGEGMEEGEFAEAREDLGFLQKDYLDVLSEQATDDYDDESD